MKVILQNMRELTLVKNHIDVLFVERHFKMKVILQNRIHIGEKHMNAPFVGGEVSTMVILKSM